MKTPAGAECKYFFGDYFRGRNHEECRLIGNNPPPNNWTPDLCQSCPVPGILRANACPFMELEGKVKRGFLGMGRRVIVTSYCTKAHQVVKEPEVGCGLCHPLPPEFIENEQ